MRTTEQASRALCGVHVRTSSSTPIGIGETANSQSFVPADKKWYRDLFVARALVERLEHFEHEWTAALEERGRAELAALRAAHLDEQASGEAHAPETGGSRKKR